MDRNNTIGIVGTITKRARLVLEAPGWKQKAYETKLERVRPSGVKDEFILQFSGKSAGTFEELKKIQKGAEVLVGGEIRSENVHEPQPEENRVKVYIYAEVIAVNDPPVNDQNEVTICGNICQPPRFRSTRRRTKKGKRVAATSVMVAVNSPTGTNYIPCVCFGWQAFSANALNIGDYVEIYGRFQSRDYKKRIEGRKLPYLTTVYEVCAIDLKSESAKDRKAEQGEKGGSDT